MGTQVAKNLMKLFVTGFSKADGGKLMSFTKPSGIGLIPRLGIASAVGSSLLPSPEVTQEQVVMPVSKAEQRKAMKEQENYDKWLTLDKDDQTTKNYKLQSLSDALVQFSNIPKYVGKQIGGPYKESFDASGNKEAVIDNLIKANKYALLVSTGTLSGGLAAYLITKAIQQGKHSSKAPYAALLGAVGGALTGKVVGDYIQ